MSSRRVPSFRIWISSIALLLIGVAGLFIGLSIDAIVLTVVAGVLAIAALGATLISGEIAASELNRVSLPRRARDIWRRDHSP